MLIDALAQITAQLTQVSVLQHTSHQRIAIGSEQITFTVSTTVWLASVFQVVVFVLMTLLAATLLFFLSLSDI